MKISEVIAELSFLKDRYGDLPVRYAGFGEGAPDRDVLEIVVYDANGNTPTCFDKAVEAYLHSVSPEGN